MPTYQSVGSILLTTLFFAALIDNTFAIRMAVTNKIRRIMSLVYSSGAKIDIFLLRCSSDQANFFKATEQTFAQPLNPCIPWG